MCYTFSVLRRNLTLNLPGDLIEQAKVYAAERDTTVNSLIETLLEEKISHERRMQAAGARFLAIAERGPYSTVDPGSIRREELHERDGSKNT